MLLCVWPVSTTATTSSSATVQSKQKSIKSPISPRNPDLSAMKRQSKKICLYEQVCRFCYWLSQDKKSCFWTVSNPSGMGGNRYKQGTDFDTTPPHSIEWISVCSVLFDLSFCHCSIDGVLHTVIPVVPSFPVDSYQGQQGLFLFRLCIGFLWSMIWLLFIPEQFRTQTIVRGRVIGNHCICRWCRFTTLITLCHQYLL